MGDSHRGRELARSKRTEPPMARNRILSEVPVGRVHARRPVGSSARTSPVSGSNFLLRLFPQGPLMAYRPSERIINWKLSYGCCQIIRPSSVETASSFPICGPAKYSARSLHFKYTVVRQFVCQL